jgi:hypothetical protein
METPDFEIQPANLNSHSRMSREMRILGNLSEFSK